MRRVHLAVQAAIVLTMVAFVSWPQFRPVRSQSLWRYTSTTVLQAKTSDAARFAGQTSTDPATVVTNETAVTQQPATHVGAAATNVTSPVVVPSPAVTEAGGKLNALVGVALTSLNAPIPYARLALRNIRTGEVLAETTANENGEYSFVDVDPNAYVVELLSHGGAVVATSIMVLMVPGELRVADVRVAAAAAAIRAALANTLTATAPQATTAAHDTGVSRTTTTQIAQVSPR